MKHLNPVSERTLTGTLRLTSSMNKQQPANVNLNTAYKRTQKLSQRWQARPGRFHRRRPTAEGGRAAASGAEGPRGSYTRVSRIGRQRCYIR